MVKPSTYWFQLYWLLYIGEKYVAKWSAVLVLNKTTIVIIRNLKNCVDLSHKGCRVFIQPLPHEQEAT